MGNSYIISYVFNVKTSHIVETFGDKADQLIRLKINLLAK